MTTAYPLLLLAGLYLLVLASPGPNFFILTQMALNGQHREARHVVFGLSTASLVWVVIALAGVATLLAQHPTLAVTIQWVGALYLVWYGGKLLYAALLPSPAPSADAAASPPARFPLHAYRIGLTTGLTNPKGAAFWTSAVATTFPSDPPTWLVGAAVVMVTLMSLVWHLGITVLFTSSPLRAAYLRASRPINGFAGLAILSLGLDRLASR